MGTVYEPVIGGPEQEQGNGRGARPGSATAATRVAASL